MMDDGDGDGRVVDGQMNYGLNQRGKDEEGGWGMRWGGE